MKITVLFISQTSLNMLFSQHFFILFANSLWYILQMTNRFILCFDTVGSA